MDLLTVYRLTENCSLSGKIFKKCAILQCIDEEFFPNLIKSNERNFPTTKTVFCLYLTVPFTTFLLSFLK